MVCLRNRPLREIESQMLRQNSSRGVIGLNLSAAVGKRAWLVIVSFTVWAAIVTTAEYVGLLPGRISPVPFTFIGLPLGFFLAFRGNQGHARYWEARQAWNTIGNSARNFGRQVAVYNNPTGDANPEALSELSRTVIRRVVAYSCALHASLTDADVEEAANKHLDVPLADLKVEGTNVAFAILHSISAELERGMKAGLLDRLFVRIMENSLAVLSDAAGTCEKIRATPLPVPLVLITNRMLILYIAGLPIGIVDVTA